MTVLAAQITFQWERALRVGIGLCVAGEAVLSVSATSLMVGICGVLLGRL